MSCPMNPTYWTRYDRIAGHVRRYTARALSERIESAGFTIERVCARRDRMSRFFGWSFSLALQFWPALMAKLIRFAAQLAGAEKPWGWVDDPSLDTAERRGGVTLQARRRGPEHISGAP